MLRESNELLSTFIGIHTVIPTVVFFIAWWQQILCAVLWSVFFRQSQDKVQIVNNLFSSVLHNPQHFRDTKMLGESPGSKLIIRKAHVDRENLFCLLRVCFVACILMETSDSIYSRSAVEACWVCTHANNVKKTVLREPFAREWWDRFSCCVRALIKNATSMAFTA